MERRIPFKILPLDRDEQVALWEVIASKNLGMGKLVNQLEHEIAEYAGSKYAVAVDSCTSALFLSLKYRSLENNGHPPFTVKIPSMTVPLVAHTVIHAGGRIHFVDECDWVGHSYPLAPYNIIDSAHEVSKDQFLKHNDDTLLCYSFYPTKPITSCEGGMILTNDRKAVEWLQKARFYGRNAGSSIAKNSWEYDIEFPGWKMNMTEVQAAIALSQLHKLPDLDKKRQSVVTLYNNLLGENRSSSYLYRINVKNRDEFIKYMDSKGVECGVHFKPLHQFECYKNCEKDNLDYTEEIGKTTVSLPLYDTLLEDDVKYISRLVNEWRANGK